MLNRLIKYSNYFIYETLRINGIRINSTAKTSKYINRILPNNWGDDLNIYFLSEIAKKPIIYYPLSLFSRYFKIKNYICIGSTIETRSNKKAIIWGAGMMYRNGTVIPPLKICAVRGVHTRNRLLELNIDCPEVYGDPALLLPKYYKPNNIKVKYKIGLIPHYVDQNNRFVIEFIKNNPHDVLFIDLKNYANWKDIINEICSCEFIISSSLHGLIVSDAYNIPNLWVEFSSKITGERFKFFDYFSSVKKDIEKPIVINETMTIERLIKFKSHWIKPDIDLNPLLKSCPFKIKKPLY